MLKRQTFLIISITITIWACNQGVNYNFESPEINPNKDNLILIELRNPDTYEYKTGISGDEEGALIKKQAKHYEVSEIVRDSTTQWEAVYRYKAQGNYVGSDEIEIETHRESDGANPPTKIEIIKIKFTITKQ